MSDDEVVLVSRIINDIVDMEHFDDAQEQEIFEFATCRAVECIVQALPNEYIRVIGSNAGIPASLADLLEQRLFDLVRRDLFLPFLDDQDFRRIARCIVVLVVSGMRSGGHRLHEMDADEKKHLICTVFLKGVLDKFCDAEERGKLVAAATGIIKDVPFVPAPILEMFAHNVICFVAQEIERALFEVAAEFEDAARDRRALELLPSGLQRALTEAEVALQQTRPFSMQLRRRTCELLNSRLEEKRSIAARTAHLCPRRARLEALLACIDIVVSSISSEKLEAAMDSVVRPFGGPPPSQVPACGQGQAGW